MKVLLQQAVATLGRAGQIVEVSESYARNFLVPKKLAVPATAQAVARASSVAAAKDAKTVAEAERVQESVKKLSGLTLTLQLPANKQGKLFAAVHEADIRGGLVRQHQFRLPPGRISGLPIKLVGEHQLNITFGPKASATLNVTITAIA